MEETVNASESYHPGSAEPVNGDQCKSDDEKLKNSSKAVFKFLNPEGKDKLKQREVLKYMKELQKGHDGSGSISDVANSWKSATRSTEKKHVKKVIHKVVGAKQGKSLKESDLVKLNKRFMDGHLPRLKKDSKDDSMQEEESCDEDTEDDDETKNLRHEAEPKKGIIYTGLSTSLRSAELLKDYMVNAVSKAGTSWIVSLLPTSQISTLFTFLLFSYIITASFLSWFIPLAILAFSMGIMVVSTMRMVRGVKRFEEFQAWADFLTFVTKDEPNSIDTSKAKENYLIKHASMYFQFFICMLFCVMAYGVSNKVWVLNAELAVLSLIMYFSIVVANQLLSKPISILIFLCQILATMLEGFHRADGGEVHGHLFSVPLPWIGMVVNWSVPVILRIIILSLVIAIPSKKEYQNLKVGVIEGALPRVIAILWWEIFALFLSNSSWYSVSRACFEFFTLLFAMPLFFLIFVLAVLKYVLSIEIMKVLITIGLVATPLIYFRVWRNKRELLHMIGDIVGANTTKAVLILIGSLAFGWFMVSYRPSGMLVSNSNLTWEEYRGLCVTSKKSHPGNPTPINVACHEFNSYSIHWHGVVKYVQISEIDNKVESLLNVLPGSVASWLSCVYGQPFPTVEECNQMPNTRMITPSPETALCAIAPYSKRKCHLQNYNIYKFKIGLAMPKQNSKSDQKIDLDDPILLQLEASHDFRQAVFKLRKGSPLEFKGVLTSDMPTVSAKILYTKSEGDEMRGYIKRYKKIETSLGMMVDESLQALQTFLFYPFVTFSPVETEE